LPNCAGKDFIDLSLVEKNDLKDTHGRHVCFVAILICTGLI
jgi:hypothetical protein